jgi:hypothetical protein
MGVFLYHLAIVFFCAPFTENRRYESSRGAAPAMPICGSQGYSIIPSMPVPAMDAGIYDVGKSLNQIFSPTIAIENYQDFNILSTIKQKRKALSSRESIRAAYTSININ